MTSSRFVGRDSCSISLHKPLVYFSILRHDGNADLTEEQLKIVAGGEDDDGLSWAVESVGGIY